MSKRKVVHVTQDTKAGGWKVKQEGISKPLKHLETKAEAIDYGKNVQKKPTLARSGFTGKIT